MGKDRRQALFQLLIILSGLLMACVVIVLFSGEPSNAIKHFFTGPFRSRHAFGNFINSAVPLILSGLAAAIAFKAGVWNLGAEGMVYTGMICGTAASSIVKDAPPLVGTLFILAAAFVGGAALSLLCSWLNRQFHVDIMMVSLLVSNVALYFGYMLVKGPMKDPLSGQGVTTYRVPENFMFGKILPPSALDTGLFLAVGLILLAYFIFRYHKYGYVLYITGRNPVFARYGGINTGVVAMVVMLVSGGLFGLGGMTYILNESGRVRTLLSGIGWNGLSVAMISRNNVALIIPVALFFSFLEHGAESAALFSDISPDVAQIIQGAILLLVTSEALFQWYRNRRNAGRPKGGQP